MYTLVKTSQTNFAYSLFQNIKNIFFYFKNPPKRWSQVVVWLKSG